MENGPIYQSRFCHMNGTPGNLYSFTFPPSRFEYVWSYSMYCIIYRINPNTMVNWEGVYDLR